MANDPKVVKALASVGGGIEDRMREAVDRILALVWDVRSDSFSFADNPEVDAEVNRVLAQMDDGMMEDAVKAAKALLKSVEMDDWEDDAVEFAERGISNETPLFLKVPQFGIMICSADKIPNQPPVGIYQVCHIPPAPVRDLQPGLAPHLRREWIAEERA